MKPSDFRSCLPFLRALAFAALAAVVLAPPARAVELVGLTASNKLVFFDAASAGTVSRTVTVTGLQGGESLLGIDYRPATGRLYGLGSSSRLYLVDETTGAASAVGSAFSMPLAGADFGFDFNPTVDRVRVVSDTGQNLRVHPDTGAIAAVDTALSFATGDPNAGRTPRVGAAAYTNDFQGATVTTLYTIDAGQNVLATQGSGSVSPNSGQLFTIGGLGIDVTSVAGFAVTPTNRAYAALNVTGAAPTGLYSIDTTSGAATKIADIGGGEVVKGLAAVISPGGTNVSILPSSARAAGLGGAFYTTDVTLTNKSATSVGYVVKFLGNGVDGRNGAERVFTLPANRSVTESDVLGSLFGLSSGFGAIRILADSQALVVSSQTSTPGGGGRFGQSVPAARSADLVRVGTPQTIAGVRQDGTARTNLVLANAIEATLDVDVALVGDDGTTLGTKRYTLPALGMTQVNAVVRDLGVPSDLVTARLVLSTPTTGGAFAAYAAYIDNGTNDPRTLLPR